MRKGASQSMYQPSKSNIGASNKFTQGIEGTSLAKSSYPVIVNRKIEGHDTLKSGKNSFEQTVTNLKNKPNNKVLEDQYINGLQEEIKYLEYELKLLKDKEILEREGVNELDNFLKDEIPINENILAMKNKYNATKAKLEEQFINLNAKTMEANDVLVTQHNQLKRLHDIIKAHRDQQNERRTEFRDKISELTKQLSLTKDEYESTGDDSRRKLDELKKMNEEIAAIQRANEKEKIMEVRLGEEKSKKVEKFQNNFKGVKESMVEAIQQIEEMDQRGDTNPLIEPLDKVNSSLRKKIMLNEKQKSTAENIIAEIELLLKEEARDREIQRQQKGKWNNVQDEYRTELQHLQRYIDTLIKDQTLRYKKIFLKDMNRQLTEKEETFDLLTDRLRNIEQECSNLIQQKKELTQSLGSEREQCKAFNQKISQLEDNIGRNKSVTESLKRLTSEILTETDPIKNDLEKAIGRIPIVEREIEKKNTAIHYLNKQVDLLRELKNLDLEQLQMISKGGADMQNVLHSFIRSWEKIKSL